MKTDILSPKALFQRDIRYTIPHFNGAMFGPMGTTLGGCETADDYLEKLDRSNDDGVEAEQETVRHFLGAGSTGEYCNQRSIDGQQRLTTLQLLLDAVQFVTEEHKIKGVAARLFKLVTNDESLVADDEDIFKLWPTTNDREAFCNGLATDDYDSLRTGT